MIKGPIFKNDSTYMPVTMQQFESLTNEILTEINKITAMGTKDGEAPSSLNADYAAQILMSALHAYKHETGLVSKIELFESCINRISCHVTYHAVNEIQERLKKQLKETSSEEQPKGLHLVPDEEAIL